MEPPAIHSSASAFSRPGTGDSNHSASSGDSFASTNDTYYPILNNPPDQAWDSFALAAYRAELARQEQLAMQQDQERIRLRRHLAREHERERGRQQRRQAGPSQGSSKEQHPVYLLNCRGCGAFLSDRGMKAVLLLKPHVTLYSTDIMPDNCGPLYPPSPYSLARLDTPEPLVERTCECLTQSLGCYGCGAQIGYHIASPCRKCTASVNEMQRGSNGHRTVLHCSEITVRERRYVPGEPGVRAASPPPPPSAIIRSVRSHPSAWPNHPLSQTATSRSISRQLQQRQATLRYHPLRPHHRVVDGGLQSSRTPSPQILSRSRQAPDNFLQLRDDPDGIDKGLQQYSTTYGLEGHYTADDDSSSPDMKPKTAADDGASPRRIERGGVVYWSDLISGSERAQPFDSDAVLAMPIAGR